jgi:hypothetical protein
VARMEKTRNAYNILADKPQKNIPYKYPGVGRKIILKCINRI